MYFTILFTVDSGDNWLICSGTPHHLFDNGLTFIISMLVSI